MRHSKIPLANTKAFSGFFLDYISQKDCLTPFYSQFPTLENFNISLTKKSKSFSSEARQILTATLQQQYQGLKLSNQVDSNIKALADSNTFTVTTGHQLNIFTGPLYFIYKIVTVINTCRALKSAYPDFNFVPVYWMASEDHDYDEIKYFSLYGKKYVWETRQHGAVGRFKTHELVQLIDAVPGDTTLFLNAYKKHSRLSDAVRYYVNELFGTYGVVVVDGDNRQQKALLKNVMREDIVKQATVEIVDKTNTSLETLGYKTQIHCRDINFFYLDDKIRSRIEKRGDVYKVLDTDLSFTESDIQNMIETEPEKFSPNVILRPLYQEMILPNLAYVGGPAEVVYWLQLKEMFAYFKIDFPILMPRNFALLMDHTTERKLGKTGLTLEDFFEDKNYIFNHWILKNSRNDLTVGQERNNIQKLFESLKVKASAIDTTLIPYVGAEGKRALNAIDKIEKKLLRAEKRLHTDRLRQIEEVKEALFPNGNLQERTDNFLNFYQKDPELIDKLVSHFDPFDFDFNVLTYVEK